MAWWRRKNLVWPNLSDLVNGGERGMYGRLGLNRVQERRLCRLYDTLRV